MIGVGKAQLALAPTHWLIKHGQTQIGVNAPLMPPATPHDSSKLGVQTESAGFDYRPLFPALIQTDKIRVYPRPVDVHPDGL